MSARLSVGGMGVDGLDVLLSRADVEEDDGLVGADDAPALVEASRIGAHPEDWQVCMRGLRS